MPWFSWLRDKAQLDHQGFLDQRYKRQRKRGLESAQMEEIYPDVKENALEKIV